MPQLAYRNFDIEIGPAGENGYPVAVIDSPGGQARDWLALPEDVQAFEQRLAALDGAVLEDPSGEAVVLAQAVGAQLFDALLPPKLRSVFDVSRSVTRQEGQGLRIKLRVNAPELATLPWEFLFDHRRGAFVALSRYTPLVRYVEVTEPDQPLAIKPPLRVLGVAASPDGVEPLDIAEEKRRVEAAVAGLVEEGLVELEWLTPATWRALQTAMQQGPWHVLHFVGHAEFDAESDEAALILADDGGEAMRLSATQLADLLGDHRTLRLAVLNACEGARGHEGSVFSSMAATLVARGLPAVVAMQYAITDDAAVEFSAGFYAALAKRYPVDAALAEARKAISLAEPNALEWATPVLHLRAPDGVIFAAEPDDAGDGADGGNVINIGSIDGSATVIGGDAQNVAVTHGGSDGGAPSAADAAAAETVKRGWFGRLFGGRAKGEESPKLIIGGDARNVIVDSRIMQFNLDGRRITVPIFLIAGALIVLLAILLFPILKPIWNPAQMEGQFNIAVAEFGELSADGRVRETAESRALSTWLYDGLASVYAETPDVPLADSVEIWHRSRTDSARDIPLRAIKGTTPEERTANAERLAERIGAHMIIYGNLIEEGDETGLDLEFYLGPKVNDETSAIVGPHSLGRPVTLPVPFDIGDPTLNQAIRERLQTRTTALFWLTIGLSEELLGRSEAALSTFRRAEDALATWQPDEGKEILQFFIAREELFLDNDAAAEEAIRQAIEINPDYARAYIVLGSIHFLRAQRIAPAERLADLSDLTAAKAAYETALTLAQEQGNPLVEHLAMLSLGMTARLEGEAYYFQKQFESALDLFAHGQENLEEALSYFDDTTQYRLIAQAYESLGLIHFERSDILRQQQDVAGRLEELEAAEAAFDACIAQATPGLFDELLSDRIVGESCQRLRDGVSQAIADL